jgi:hypothetical protein
MADFIHIEAIGQGIYKLTSTAKIRSQKIPIAERPKFCSTMTT